MTGKMGMIVFDKEDLDRMCVAYFVSRINGVDFLSAVEECLNDLKMDATPKTMERIAKDVFHKGFCNWKSLHFEILFN